MRSCSRWLAHRAGAPLIVLGALGTALAVRWGHVALERVPAMVRPELRRALGRDVRMGRASVSWTGRVTVQGISIADGTTFKSGVFVRARRAVVGLSLTGLLLHRRSPAAALRSIRLEEPDLLLVRHAPGRWNFSDLAGGGVRAGGKGSFRGQVVIANGRVTLRDYATHVGPGPVVTRFEDVTGQVVTARPGSVVVALSARGLQGAVGRVALSGRYGIQSQSLDLQLEFDGADVGRWQRYFGTVRALPVRSGIAAGRVKVAWTPRDGLQLSGSVRAPHLVMAPRRIRTALVAAPLIARFDGNRLLLDAHAHTGGIALSLTGSVRLRDPLGLMDLTVRAPRVMAAQARQAVRSWPALPGVAWDSPVRLDVHIHGSPLSWVVDTAAHTPRLRAQGIPLSNVHALVSYQGTSGRAVVRSVQARAAGGTVLARGWVASRSRPAYLRMAGEATGVDLARIPLLPEVRRSGRAWVRFEAAGPLGRVTVQAAAAGSGLTVDGARLARVSGTATVTSGAFPVARIQVWGLSGLQGFAGIRALDSATGTVVLLGDRARLSNSRATLGGQAISLSGTVARSDGLDLQVRAARVQVAAFAAALGAGHMGGTGSLTARITGTRARPHIAGRVEVVRGRAGQVSFGRGEARFAVGPGGEGAAEWRIANARVARLPVASASGRALLQGQEVLVRDAVVQLPGGVLALEGRVGRNGSLDLAARMPRGDLSALAAAVDRRAQAQARGRASFAGRVRGRADAPVLDGEVVARSGSLRGLAFTELRARGQAGSAGLVLQELVLRGPSGALNVRGALRVGRGRPLSGDVSVRADSLHLKSALSALGVPTGLSGRADARLRVSGPMSAPSIAGDLRIAEARLGRLPLGEVTARMTRRGGHTRIQRVVLTNGSSRLTASGMIGPAARIDLRLEGTQVPLESLEGITGAYARLEGRVDLRGTVSGRLDDPRLHLRVRGGPIVVNGGSRLGSVSGALAYSAGEVQASELGVSWGRSSYFVRKLTLRPRQGWFALDASARNADLGGLLELARGLKFPDTPFGRSLRVRLDALPSPLAGEFTGTASLAGKPSRLSGEARFSVEDALIGEARLQHVAGNARWAPGRVAFSEGVLVADGVRIAGDVVVGRGDWLEMRVRLEKSRLEALRRLAQWARPLLPAGGTADAWDRGLAALPDPFTGEVTGRVDVAGPLDALDGSVQVALRSARFGEARVDQAATTLQWRSGSVSVDDLAIRAPGVDLAGAFSWRADGQTTLDLRLAETDLDAARDLARVATAPFAAHAGASEFAAGVSEALARLPQRLSGKASLNLALTGGSGSLEGRVRVQGEKLQVGELTLGQAAAEARWSPEGWALPVLEVEGAGYTIRGSASVGAGERLTADIGIENARVEELRRAVAGATFLTRLPGAAALVARAKTMPTPLSGAVTARVRLSGTARDPDGWITLSGTGVGAGGQSLDRVAASAEFRGGILTIRDLDARTNGGSLRVSGTVDLDGPLNLKVNGSDFLLSALGPLLGARSEISGHLALDAAVTGTVDAPEVRAAVTVTDATIGGVAFRRIQAAEVRVAGGRADLGRVELVHDSVVGTVEGFLPFRWHPIAIPADEPIQLRVSLPAYDLAYLAALTPALESASGKLDAELSVTGTLRDPALGGTLSARGGHVKLAGFESSFTDLNARLRFERPWIVVEAFESRSDLGGRITAEGRAHLRGASGEPFSLRARAERLGIALRDLAGTAGTRLTGLADGEVSLNVSGPRPALTGQITLSQVQLALPAEVIPVSRPRPKLPLNPTLDVEIRIGDGAWLKRGHGLSALVTGSMLARGTLADPVVGGRMVIERGDLHYAGHGFRLQPGGALSFSYSPPNPLTARLDVKALTRVRVLNPPSQERRPYDVTLHVTGTVPDVNVTVTSDPPDLPQYRLWAILARTDQFEALAAGMNVNTLLRDQFADIVSGTVLPQVFEPIEQGLAQALGLDEVNFDYGFDRPLRLDARKEILPRLFVSYNRDASQGQVIGGREQWSLTYRIYQRLHLGWRRDTTARKDRLVLEGSFRF